jgi:hypothetical protein
MVGGVLPDGWQGIARHLAESCQAVGKVLSSSWQRKVLLYLKKTQPD